MKIIKYLFKAYYIIATTIVSIILITAVIADVMHYYDYIEFPNKSYLVYSGLFKNEFILKDSNNKLLVDSNIEYVKYNDEYVYGNRNYGNKKLYFISNNYWEESEEYENVDHYKNRLQELNLNELQNDANTYDDLFKYSKLAKHWYQ